MEYTSKGVGNAALTTGIIGTSLGALSSAGGLAGLLGLGGPRPGAPVDPGDRPVTRYEMELFQQINAKDNEIAVLKANQYSDNKNDILQAQINQQAVWTAGATATMGFMGQQIQALYGVMKLGVPDTSVMTSAAPATSGASNG